VKAPKRQPRCLRCAARLRPRALVPLALAMLQDRQVHDDAGDHMLAALLGYCSLRCARCALVGPLVALRLLGVAR
jgi:hypothetical protein